MSQDAGPFVLGTAPPRLRHFVSRMKTNLYYRGARQSWNRSLRFLGAAIAGYHLYFLDENGRIRDAADLESGHDETALTHAMRRHDGRAMEVWSGARMVGKIPSKPPTTP